MSSSRAVRNPRMREQGRIRTSGSAAARTDVIEWQNAVNVIAVEAADGDLVGGFLLAVRALTSRSREAELVQIRSRAFERLRANGWSLPRIGAAAGYHHTTVLHHLERLAQEET